MPRHTPGNTLEIELPEFLLSNGYDGGTTEATAHELRPALFLFEFDLMDFAAAH